MKFKDKKIVVAIPCYNEALTITKVINDFRRVLPDAKIYVFDNNSTDDSVKLAKKAGADIYFVKKQGKGNVMRAILETIDADALIVVDGDDTYNADEVFMLLEPIINGKADMVVGNRLNELNYKSFRKFHYFGNRMIVSIVNKIFGTNYNDILSGYRVFSRKFIESIPLLKSGFETETEMTLQALENGLEVIEIPISHKNRPEGSYSKLKTFRDGFRILLTAFTILRDHKPMKFFGFFSSIFFFIVFVAGLLRILNYLNITNLPSQILTGLILLFLPTGMISFGIGLILSSINTRFREIKYLIMRSRKK